MMRKPRTLTEETYLFTRAEIAYFFSVSTPNVTQWVAKGCPRTDYVHTDGHQDLDLYGLREVYYWRMVNIRSAPSDRTDEAENLKLEKLQLEVAKARGTLIDRDEAVELIGRYIAACRARLLCLPTRLAARVAGSSKPAVVEDRLPRGVEEALEELRAVGPADLGPD